MTDFLGWDVVRVGAARHRLVCSLLVALTGVLSNVPSAAGVPPPIRYELDLRQPATHLVRVRITVTDAPAALQIQFPAWNALYQMRDFVRHVQNPDGICDGASAGLTPVDINTWQTGSERCRQLTITYGVYANEESVFSAVLNDGHAFLNLAQVLFYLPASRSSAVTMRLLLPAGWKLATPLEQNSAASEYAAQNYDELVDSPVEAGNFDEYRYQQSGAQFQVVAYSDGAKYSSKKLVDSLERITATEIHLMRDVPFRHYTFIVHFLPYAGGGMEHAYGTAVGFSQDDLSSDWEDLEATLAHEFFHLWNVKRIRPQGLEPVDYVHGNDTRDLWFSEGVTSTYQELVLERSGLIPRQDFYRRLATKIEGLEARPARHFMSAELSGIDAWLEGYEDYDRPERSISYYDKGELLGILLDLGMRSSSRSRASLDDLMRALNRDFARRRRFFQDGDLIALVGQLTDNGFDAGSFFRDYVSGTRDLDYQRYLGYAGLNLSRELTQVADWGFRTESGYRGPLQVESVESEGKAAQAGIRPGDVITAVNGRPLTVAPERLLGAKPGQRVELEVERQSRKMKVKLQLGATNETHYQIAEDPRAPPAEVELRNRWLEPGSATPSMSAE
jgi:predicted metalloprotease with PDZ domain